MGFNMISLTLTSLGSTLSGMINIDGIVLSSKLSSSPSDIQSLSTTYLDYESKGNIYNDSFRLAIVDDSSETYTAYSIILYTIVNNVKKAVAYYTSDQPIITKTSEAVHKYIQFENFSSPITGIILQSIASAARSGNGTTDGLIHIEDTTTSLDDNYSVYSKSQVDSLIPKKVSDLTDDVGIITTETDPTVPSWAKANSKPSYNLDEVSDGTNRKLSNYVPTTRKINTKALSSDITLSLDDVADGTNRKIPTKVSALTNDSGYITSSSIPTKVSDLTNDSGFISSYTETDPTVPSWAKANSKPSYDLDEVSDGSTRKLSNYVQTSRKVNSKALSSDITLSLDDVADGTNRKIPTKVSTLTNDSGFITSSSLPTKVSDLTNDSGFITSSDIPSDVSSFNNDSGYITSSDLPTNVSDLNNDSGFITSSALSGYVQSSSLKEGAYVDVDETTMTSSSTNLPTSKAVASYITSLSLATASQIPTKVSDLTNDSGFITSSSLPTVNNTTITIKKNSDDTGDSFTTNASSTKTINLGLSAVATSGSYNDLSNKPTIPTVNNTTITIKKNSDDTGDSFTTNASSTKTINLGLSAVATSGSYSDLSNKPSIPTVNNATLTIKKNSDDTGTIFTANASTDVTANLGLATVATSGSYSDLSNKPTIPTVNNTTITIKKNSDDTGDSFTTNASSTKTINLGLATVATSGSYSDLSNKPTIPADTGDLTNNAGFISQIKTVNNESLIGSGNITISGGSSYTAGEGIAISSGSIKTTGIPFGIVDSTSTSTAYTVTVPGIYKLENGVTCMVKNGVVTSASGFTINVNSLGDKPVYSSLAAASRETTIFNKNYTLILVYDSTRVDGGAWLCYRATDTNAAYVRFNDLSRLPTHAARYYKLYFTSADGTKWVPASANTTNNATSARAVNQEPIDPFGTIAYTSSSTNYTTSTNIAPSSLWTHYSFTLGYSFNRTGSAWSLTVGSPVYVKCAPQTNGSAIIDSATPIVQTLPSAADDKIYIFLGVAISATKVEMTTNHPVYYHDGTGIRIWSGGTSSASPDYLSLIGKSVTTGATGEVGVVYQPSSTYEFPHYEHTTDYSTLNSNLESAGWVLTNNWVSTDTYIDNGVIYYNGKITTKTNETKYYKTHSVTSYYSMTQIEQAIVDSGNTSSTFSSNYNNSITLTSSDPGYDSSGNYNSRTYVYSAATDQFTLSGYGSVSGTLSVPVWKYQAINTTTDYVGSSDHWIFSAGLGIYYDSMNSYSLNTPSMNLYINGYSFDRYDNWYGYWYKTTTWNSSTQLPYGGTEEGYFIQIAENTYSTPSGDEPFSYDSSNWEWYMSDSAGDPEMGAGGSIYRNLSNSADYQYYNDMSCMYGSDPYNCNLMFPDGGGMSEPITNYYYVFCDTATLYAFINSGGYYSHTESDYTT